MRSFCFLLVLSLGFFSKASVEVGLGASSVFQGRAVAALALGYYGEQWGGLYRSAGVQTPIYAQNAWSVAGLRMYNGISIGSGRTEIGAGLGVTSILRSYRESVTAVVEDSRENVFGPHFLLKISFGYFFFSFDTLLGLDSQVAQHLVLNFRDVSHVALGVTF